jgi:RNA polymerase sigma factor (sigma-70 family)
MHDELDRAYREHRHYVRGCLRRAGLDRDALDDAVHDVFAVLVRRRADVDPRWSIRQYLAGIAKNVAANHRRRARRADPGALVQWGNATASALELRIDLTRELASLEPPQRDAVLQSDREGCSAAEIARAHGVPLTTVQWRLRCAHQRLRSMLDRWRDAAAAIIAIDLRRLWPARTLAGGLAASLVVTTPAIPPGVRPPTPAIVAASVQPTMTQPLHSSASASVPTLALVLPATRVHARIGTVRLGTPHVLPSTPPIVDPPQSRPKRRAPTKRRATPRSLFPADAIYWVMEDHPVHATSGT